MLIRNATEELEERRCPPCGTTMSNLRLANYSRNFNHMYTLSEGGQQKRPLKISWTTRSTLSQPLVILSA